MTTGILKQKEDKKTTTLMTNLPINLDDQGSIFYYEVTLRLMKVNDAKTTFVKNLIIGMCSSDQKKDKHLGSGKNSYGYQSNGKLFHNEKDSNAAKEEYGPQLVYADQEFDVKDTIGCGYLVDKKEMFFTKNGEFIEIAFKDVDIPKEGFYPAVCFQSISHSISANFGQQKFMFDLEGFRQREGLESFFDICQTPFDSSKLHGLVKSYLVHYAYVETI